MDGQGKGANWDASALDWSRPISAALPRLLEAKDLKAAVWRPPGRLGYLAWRPGRQGSTVLHRWTPIELPGELDNLSLAVADDGAYSPPVGIPQECRPALAAR